MVAPAARTLSCEALAAALGGRTVFADLSASFPPGSLTILAGPNGAGKTTLLRALARALAPSAGRVRLGGADAASLPRRAFARRVAYLPQRADADSLAGLSVRDAVACGRLPHTGFFGGETREDAAAVDRALADAGLDGFAARDAASLSGGETRRMLLAAALAQEADTLLLDEPFEGLDAASRARLAALLRRLAASGHAIVVATHDRAPLADLPSSAIELPAPPAGAAAAGARPAARGAAAFALALLAPPALLALAAWLFLRGRDPSLLLPYHLPRLLCAFWTGGILAVAGCVYQTLFRNPLASPYTLGTASGATFGAFLATALLPAGALPVGAAAFAGALLSLAVVRACGGNGKSARLLLGGVACAYLFAAGTMLCQLALSPWESLSMAHWSLGSVAVPSPFWRAALPLAWCASLAPAAFPRVLDAFLAGDDAAFSHGLDAARVRLALLGFTSLLVACAVAVCGPIGFVGLLVPHLGRLAAGAAHRRLVPVCAVGGGSFLALCDLAARSLPTPAALPVGVLTALLGAPALVALLARRR